MIELKLDTFENQIVIIPNFEKIEESNELYLKEDKFINFLQIFIDNTIKENNVCIYNNFINTIEESFLHFDFTTMKVKIPVKIKSFVELCNNNHSLIIIPIRFLLVKTEESIDEFKYNNIDNKNLYNDLYTAHSNLIFIDNNKKTIELFEPHGFELIHLTGKAMLINNIIENTIKNNFEFTKNYFFSNSASFCLLGGVQAIQNIINNKSGHCLAWSLLFIVLRIVNTHLNLIIETNSEFIHRYLTHNFTAEQLDTIIKRFITIVNSMYNNIEKTFDEYTIVLYKNDFIENRIKYISSLYFVNITTAFDNKTLYNAILYEELISYRFYPKFHEIVKEALMENFQNDF